MLAQNQMFHHQHRQTSEVGEGFRRLGVSVEVDARI